MSGSSGTSISFQSAMNHLPEKEKYIFPRAQIISAGQEKDFSRQGEEK